MVMVYMFKQLGTICDEYFVPSLEVIVEKLEIPNDVAGATFMAAGSSAPELFTSLVATFLIVNEGGIGTIVGSAIFNILVIVGATGLIACKDQSLNIWWYPLTRDCAFYTLAIIELTLVLRDE
jgi:Ca2+/Na+ antiporter